MLEQISLANNGVVNNSLQNAKTQTRSTKSPVSNSIQTVSSKSRNVEKMLSAYHAYNNIRLASSVNFGSSLASAFEE